MHTADLADLAEGIYMGVGKGSHPEDLLNHLADTADRADGL